jgi:hypothetical protein
MDEYIRECPGKINDDGTVTFDVASRTISVSAECEVTTTEAFDQSWSV